MGLLDKLWDDVVAGPRPEKGLSKLRQAQTGCLPEGYDSDQAMMDRRRSGEFQQNETEARRVTQSITIKKPPSLQTAFDSSDSPSLTSSPYPSSPMASSPMASPAAGQERPWRSVFQSPGQNKNVRRMSSSKFDSATPMSPTVYDWVVISALDK